MNVCVNVVIIFLVLYVLYLIYNEFEELSNKVELNINCINYFC